MTHENNISELESAYATDCVAFASSSDNISIQIETQETIGDGDGSKHLTQTTGEWMQTALAALALGLTRNKAP